MPEWSYDAGPDPQTKMGKELIDITAAIPNMPMVSNKIMGKKQKFRPAFGPIPWRMRQDTNAVKILFMGQDGTHIAEAAGRPATAGFGGRAQDFANYFGVNEGAAFINAYAFTIKGQYGVYGSPYFYKTKGKLSVRSANLVSNQLWLMSNHLDSPVVKWRNSLIDWTIRNNKESMKLIVLFGGAARDAIASYAISKGAEVKGRFEAEMQNIQVPELREEYAGGNNTFPSILSKNGEDLYSDIVGEDLDYTKSSDQKKATQSLKNNIKKYMESAVLTKAGPFKNGLINSAQLGGYDLDSMNFNHIETRSLKGIVLDDGSVVENDLIVISLPHPSSLSRTVMDADTYGEGMVAASVRVMKDVSKLNQFKQNGWKIEPDLNKVNLFDQGETYQYGRSDIGPEFYDFGTPKNRMVSKSTARRMSGNPNVVIIGTRDNANFSKKKIENMTNAGRDLDMDNEDLFIARPRSLESRYKFDPGPGTVMAKIMIESLDEKSITMEKAGMNFENDGIAAFNIKTHPSVSDFGHYRGTFNNPEVIMICDPIGYDDLITARALTGTRGQYLHGMFEDLGVDDNYLVIKTVPFGMDGANEKEWATVLAQTNNYRDAIFKEILKNNKPKVIVADGENAFKEAKRLFKGMDIQIVEIERRPEARQYGIKTAAAEIAKVLNINNKNINIRMANIPRTHLSFYSRTWEGTSGDRVITSKGLGFQGIAFAEVVPSWAYSQEAYLKENPADETQVLLNYLRNIGLPLPNERIPTYLNRVHTDSFLDLFIDNQDAA